MSHAARYEELSALRMLLEYARATASDLEPAPSGLLAALKVALDEVRSEARRGPGPN